MPRNLFSAVEATGLLAGCATSTQTELADMLDYPIDCAVAETDIAALEAAIPGTAERIASGVRLVVPAARIVDRATGQIDTRREIASRRPENDLRACIAETEATCPTSPPLAAQGV